MLHRQKSLSKKSELDQSDALSACLVLSLRDTANVNLIWLIWAQLHNGLSASLGQRVSLPLIDLLPPLNSIFHCQASQTAKTWRSAGRKQGSRGRSWLLAGGWSWVCHLIPSALVGKAEWVPYKAFYPACIFDQGGSAPSYTREWGGWRHPARGVRYMDKPYRLSILIDTFWIYRLR